MSIEEKIAEIRLQVEKLVDSVTDYAPTEKEGAIATFMDWLCIDFQLFKAPISSPIEIPVEVECECQNHACGIWSMQCKESDVCMNVGHGTEDCVQCTLYATCQGTGRITVMKRVMKSCPTCWGLPSLDDKCEDCKCSGFTPALHPEDTLDVLKWKFNGGDKYRLEDCINSKERRES